jgi:FkbM family methyltransferase
MMSAWPAGWVPSALWSRQGRAHSRWMRRQNAADRADSRGETFEYPHPLAGGFVYHPSDYLSRRIYLYDDFERRELEAAMACARGGGLIVDVGANIGLYTVACARAAANRGHVLAVEPGPDTFARLTRTCARLRLPNVTLLNVAASARNATAALVTPKGGRDVHQHLADARAHDAADCITVETRTLDDMCEDRRAVSLIKIDVEGHECDVLAGARGILAAGRASLIVEACAAALEAAGASLAALWAALDPTHRCDRIIASDGSEHPGRLHILEGAPPDAVFNTLWSARTA